MTMANDIWSARRPAEATRSSWRFYPLAIVAAMGFVFLGVFFLAGILIMAYNLIMTVRSPRTAARATDISGLPLPAVGD